jgi:hypothetical protein
VTPFTGFTDAQWTAIQTARADWPINVNWAAVRRKLEQAGRDFWAMRVRRIRRPPKAQRARLKRALKHLHELDQLVVELGIKHTFIGLKRGLENRLVIYEAWSGRDFEGRADAHRELLYMRIIQQWTGPLKGQLRFSRIDGTADGPLVRYLAGVLAAVLGNETPGPAGIAKIIRKDKERRRRLVEEWQRRNNDTLNAKNIFKV